MNLMRCVPRHFHDRILKQLSETAWQKTHFVKPRSLMKKETQRLYN